MSQGVLFIFGIACFALTITGVVFTVAEFRRLERDAKDNDKP